MVTLGWCHTVYQSTEEARPTRPFRTLACDGTIDVDQQPSKA